MHTEGEFFAGELIPRDPLSELALNFDDRTERMISILHSREISDERRTSLVQNELNSFRDFVQGLSGMASKQVMSDIEKGIERVLEIVHDPALHFTKRAHLAYAEFFVLRDKALEVAGLSREQYISIVDTERPYGPPFSPDLHPEWGVESN